VVQPPALAAAAAAATLALAKSLPRAVFRRRLRSARSSVPGALRGSAHEWRSQFATEPSGTRGRAQPGGVPRGATFKI